MDTQGIINLAISALLALRPRIAVNAGDYIEITTTTPAWPTNPAGCRFWGHVTVRR